MHIMERVWKASEVADLAGLPKEKMQLWLGRGLPVGEGVRGGGGHGRHREFDFRNVMEFAVARALVDQGFPAARAFHFAARFAYSWTGENIAGLPLPSDRGTTVLAISGNSHVVGPMTVELIWQLSEQEGVDSVQGFVAANVSAVFHNVCLAAGEDSNAILKEAYRTWTPVADR